MSPLNWCSPVSNGFGGGLPALYRVPAPAHLRARPQMVDLTVQKSLRQKILIWPLPRHSPSSPSPRSSTRKFRWTGSIFHRLPTPTCHIVNPDRAASRRHHSTHEAKASIEDMRERYAAERRPRESGLFAFRVESTSERFHVHRRH